MVKSVHKFLGISLRADINSNAVLAPKLAHSAPRNSHHIIFFAVACSYKAPIIFKQINDIFLNIRRFNFFKHKITYYNFNKKGTA